jgi:hypothetical protein
VHFWKEEQKFILDDARTGVPFNDSSLKVCIPAEKHVEFQSSLESVTMIS